TSYTSPRSTMSRPISGSTTVRSASRTASVAVIASASPGTVAQRELALARQVDRLAQHARGFLRRVEARRVLRLHEVEEELRLALEILRGRELAVGAPGRARRLEIADQRDERVHRAIAELERPLLDHAHARLQLVLGPLVARLAGAVDVEERA